MIQQSGSLLFCVLLYINIATGGAAAGWDNGNGELVSIGPGAPDHPVLDRPARSRSQVHASGLGNDLSTSTVSKELIWENSTDLQNVFEAARGSIVMTDADAEGYNHLVWRSERHGTNGELYHVKIGPNGSVASDPLRLTRTPGESTNPKLVLGPEGRVHVFFKESTPKGAYYNHLAVRNGTIVRPPHEIAVTGKTTAAAATNDGIHFFVAYPLDPQGRHQNDRDRVEHSTREWETDSFSQLNHYVLDTNGTVLNRSALVETSSRITARYDVRHDEVEHLHSAFARAIYGVKATGKGNTVYLAYLTHYVRRAYPEDPTAPSEDYLRGRIYYAKVAVGNEAPNITTERMLAQGSEGTTMPNPANIDGVEMGIGGWEQSGEFLHLVVHPPLPRGGNNEVTHSEWERRVGDDYEEFHGYLRAGEDGQVWSTRHYHNTLVGDESRLFLVTEEQTVRRFNGSGFERLGSVPEYNTIGLNAHGYPIVVRQDEDGHAVSSIVGIAVTTTPTSTATVTETTTTNARSTKVDSDGDGVPDDEDYAPKDPDVQEKSDLNGGNPTLVGMVFWGAFIFLFGIALVKIGRRLIG